MAGSVLPHAALGFNPQALDAARAHRFSRPTRRASHPTSGKESGRVVPLDRQAMRLQTGQVSGAGQRLEPYANYTSGRLRPLVRQPPHTLPTMGSTAFHVAWS